jgi:hypothetical protein
MDNSGENHPLYGIKKESHPNFGKTPWNKGILHTQKAKAKMSASNKGKTKNKPKSEKTKLKISIAMMGKLSPIKDKPQTKITCPHCDKTGGESNMKRYHFDNCKFR